MTPTGNGTALRDTCLRWPARNANGLGDFSDIAAVTVSNCKANPPSGLTATHGTDGSILLKWSGNSDRYNFSLTEVHAETFTRTSHKVTDGSNTYEIKPAWLKSGTLYEIWMYDPDTTCKLSSAAAIRVTAP